MTISTERSNVYRKTISRFFGVICLVNLVSKSLKASIRLKSGARAKFSLAHSTLDSKLMIRLNRLTIGCEDVVWGGGNLKGLCCCC